MSFANGYALLVGVGGDLPNTEEDARGLATILRDPERCSYPATHVSVLTGANATQARVLEAFDVLSGKTDENAMVVVYFSGHGYLVNSARGKEYFLMPHGYSLKDLPGTAISDQQFADALGRLRTKKLLVLLDCCHAGGLERAKGPGMLEKAP